MGSSVNKNDVVIPLTLGGIMLGVAYAVIPLVFGPRIEVSPFLLFAIVVVSNLAHSLVPEPAGKAGKGAMKLFWMRLAASLLLSGLVVVIYRVARTYG
jgi:hypothetical protein